VVVIPALDEIASVAAVVDATPRSVCGLDTECLVVDDGSTDGTETAARAAGALVCRLPLNLGQGRAFRVGYQLALDRGAQIIATLDADGQFDPRELAGLVAPLVAGEADLVNGSRRLGRSSTTDPVRRIGVAVFAGLVTALTRVKITDPANGFRAFRSEVVEAVPLTQVQYQTPELLIGAIGRGFRVKEVGVTVLERTAGESKKGSNFYYGYRFARVIVTTWWGLRATPSGRGRARRRR
jgi:glycosyltransferase involved in cell wall biosynthesis